MAEMENGSGAGVVNGGEAVPLHKKGRGHYRRRNQYSSAKHNDAVEGDVEKEFLNLMAKMKETHLGKHLVYQINSYVEGIECTFRLSRDQTETAFTKDFAVAGHKDKQPKVLTPEQKARLQAKREKKRLAFQKKLAARAAEKTETVAADSTATAAGGGDAPKES